MEIVYQDIITLSDKNICLEGIVFTFLRKNDTITKGGVLYMTREEKLKFYWELKMRIAQDGKSHSSVMTNKGVFIDDKLYSFKKAESLAFRRSR